ncbi:hypothetical protein T492DRAFT_1104657 [Pavlovales sp. CCMP2436]|nr:hypothetical protein T492DRAFT_1104657 [Pavlovales sp. CCMP2436]
MSEVIEHERFPLAGAAPGGGVRVWVVQPLSPDASDSEAPSGENLLSRFPYGDPGGEAVVTPAGPPVKRRKRTHMYSGDIGDRTFVCDEPDCGYRTTTTGNLKAHKRTHSGERPYACDEAGCGYCATTAGNLKAHKRTHSGERPYVCDEAGCEYRATTAGNLKAHKKKHSGALAVAPAVAGSAADETTLADEVQPEASTEEID